MTTTTTSKTITALKAWELSNPLRAWRAANKVGRQTVAGALGVTQNAVVAWEAGSNTPTDEHLVAIGRLLGDTKVSAHWSAWRAQNPTL